MNTRSAALLMSAFATTGCLLLSGCTGSTSGTDDASTPATATERSAVPDGGSTASDGGSAAPDDGSASPSAGSGVIASASPTTIPAPEESDDVRGVEVELSSSTSSAGEPVQVTVTVPKRLSKETVVLVSPADDGSLNLITPPVQVNKDLQAFMTLDMGKTMTFRAIVPDDDVSDDAVTLPADADILGQSEDFTITVE